MAQKDAIIRNLEHQIEEKDRELAKMKESTGGSAPAYDDRVREIEKHIVHLESNIKGLTDEVLDLKAIVMKITAGMTEKSSAKPRVIMSRPQGAEVVERREPTKHVAPQQRPDVRADDEAGEDTAMIMQSDGTLRPEKRKNKGMIVAQSGNAIPLSEPRNSSGDRRRRDSKKEEIIIGKRSVEKRDVEPVIFAEDNDSVEIKKK